MSMAQISRSARPALVTAELPPEEQYNTSLYFIYGNHYSIDEFVALFPFTMVGRASKIRGWQWHINEKGLPNLRLAYDRLDGAPSSKDLYLLSGDVLLPNNRYPNGIEAWGYIVSIEREYDQQIHEYFNKQGKQRIHHLYEDKLDITDLDTGEELEVEISENIIVYVDLVNTRDMNPSTPFLTSSEERLKWKNGLIELEERGVPGWYVDDLCDRLMQKPVQVEPIYIARDPDLTCRVKQKIRKEHNAEVLGEIPVFMEQSAMMLAAAWDDGELLAGGALGDGEEIPVFMEQNEEMLAAGRDGRELPAGGILGDEEEIRVFMEQNEAGLAAGWDGEELPAGGALGDGENTTEISVGETASSVAASEEAEPEVEGDTIAARLRGRTRSSRPQRKLLTKGMSGKTVYED